MTSVLCLWLTRAVIIVIINDRQCSAHAHCYYTNTAKYCTSANLMLAVVMSCATVRRHCDCFIVSLAPFINIQTYLLTYCREQPSQKWFSHNLCFPDKFFFVHLNEEGTYRYN